MDVVLDGEGEGEVDDVLHVRDIQPSGSYVGGHHHVGSAGLEEEVQEDSLQGNQEVGKVSISTLNLLRASVLSHCVLSPWMLTTL